MPDNQTARVLNATLCVYPLHMGPGNSPYAQQARPELFFTLFVVFDLIVIIRLTQRVWISTDA